MAEGAGVVAIAVAAVLGGSAVDGSKMSAAPATESGSFVKMRLGPDGIAWSTFVAMQTAAAEAARRGVNVEVCRILVAEVGDDLVVAFFNPAASPGSLGCSPGPCSCFEVHLTIDGRRVLQAHGSR